MGKYFSECDGFVLKINCKDHVLIRKSPECRFYYDDVFVEVIADKRYIIAEDSYEYGVYPELSGALTQIKTTAVNDVVASIGAPGDKGGLLLLFKKLDDNIALYIKTPRKKTVYSATILISELLKWNDILETLYLKKTFQ